MQYDFIIIGTGAGGGTIAAQLAATGARILILERGQFLPRERENWDMKAVASGRYQADETWYDADDKPFRPYTHYWVGGNTKVYGAALLRLREDDFRAVKHHGGTSPAWPVSYADLEPYYTRAERMYHVHGKRGVDPFDPPASEPYPGEPLDHEPRIGELFTDLQSLGYRPFPVALGAKLPRRGERKAPVNLSWFDGYPDLTRVKADAETCGIEPALASRNVTLMIGARVDRLVTDATGRRVTGVLATIDGDQQEFHADTVIVACGAVNSAALFLRSANAAHPAGLANSSGQVGRNYMCHHNGLLLAISDTPNDSVFQKTFGMTDFYRGTPDSPLPLGTIQLMGKPDYGTYESLSKGVPELAGKSGPWLFDHAIDFFLTSEDLPHPDNRVTLRPDGTIKLTTRPTNLEAYQRLEAKTISVLDDVDRRRGRKRATYLTLRLGVSGTSHQCGTMRFGTDPRTSVLDLNCKPHDLDNVYVVDSSFFPSSGAVNPSLTIMANALRVGDHLIQMHTHQCRTPRHAEVAR